MAPIKRITQEQDVIYKKMRCVERGKAFNTLSFFSDVLIIAKWVYVLK